MIVKITCSPASTGTPAHWRSRPPAPPPPRRAALASSCSLQDRVRAPCHRSPLVCRPRSSKNDASPDQRQEPLWPPASPHRSAESPATERAWARGEPTTSADAGTTFRESPPTSMLGGHSVRPDRGTRQLHKDMETAKGAVSRCVETRRQGRRASWVTCRGSERDLQVRHDSLLIEVACDTSAAGCGSRRSGSSACRR